MSNVVFTLATVAVTKAFTATVACIKMTYKIEIINFQQPAQYYIEEGTHAYYVNDQGNYYGNTYYDYPLTPQQWKTNPFAILAYNAIYGYDVNAKSYA